jgi:hypothetical protein
MAISRDEDNPRLQCDNCGKWRRLWDAKGNQLSFPVEDTWLREDHPELNLDSDTDYSHDNLCVWCHKVLFGIILPPLVD